MKKHIVQISVLVITDCVTATAAHAEDNAAELAKKLSNPIAALISVPIQGNFDENYGIANDGERYVVNIQPVIPISLNDDWNVISRTILPIINQNDVPTGEHDSGVGDVVQSLFFFTQSTHSRWLDLGCRPRVIVAHRE